MRLRSWARTVVVFVVVTAMLAPAIYWIAVTIRPPRTSDGHGVMPLGQVALAILGSPLGGAIAAWRLGRRRVAAPPL